MPTAPIRLAKNDVLDLQTNQPILAISKEAVHMPSFLSSKPLLTLTRCATNSQLGTIRFHNVTTSDIELQINGRSTVLSSGLLHHRWSFQPTTVAPASKGGSQWFWQRCKYVKGSLVLTDAKKQNGNVIARMERDVLVFERVALSSETLDEIVLSAVALAENVRRQRNMSASAEMVNVSGAIAGSAGGGGDGGGGGCGGDGGGGGGGGGC